jgi:ABC-type multidrug transport system ATPase subunit
MNQIAIRASALTRQFSSVRALNDLTIEVPAGVVFGFLGPNGAGRSADHVESQQSAPTTP